MAAKLKLVKNPLSAAETQEAITRFCAGIGPKAYVSIYLQSFDAYTTRKNNPKPLTASLYARGMYPEKQTLRVEGDTFDEILAALKGGWAEYAEKHGLEVIKAMALEIIRVTDERGTCSDADLRAEKFSHDEVVRFGFEACTKAAEMASKGPFVIITTSGSNFVGAAE